MYTVDYTKPKSYAYLVFLHPPLNIPRSVLVFIGVIYLALNQLFGPIKPVADMAKFAGQVAV